jgi:hypothetical protein
MILVRFTAGIRSSLLHGHSAANRRSRATQNGFECRRPGSQNPRWRRADGGRGVAGDAGASGILRGAHAASHNSTATQVGVNPIPIQCFWAVCNAPAGGALEGAWCRLRCDASRAYLVVASATSGVKEDPAGGY